MVPHFLLLAVLALFAPFVEAFATLASQETPRTDSLVLKAEPENRREWIRESAAFFFSVAALLTTTKPALAVADPYKVRMVVRLDRNDPATEDVVEIEVLPEWAPLAAERFKELLDIKFFDDSRFYRVLPGFVAQFGIASDPAVNKEWLFCEKGCRALVDEPRLQSNKPGTLSFATSGKNTRQTQIFVNLGDNSGIPNFLDQQGFVPFARVTKGFDTVVKNLNSDYGRLESMSGGLKGSVSQGRAMYYGKEYLDTLFPKLSVIKTVRMI